MAGSYKHVVKDDGSLDKPARVCGMLETSSGDVYEAVEEMYGMIWWLAEQYARSLEEAQGEREGTHSAADLIEDARKRYPEGLVLSPTERFKDLPRWYVEE